MRDENKAKVTGPVERKTKATALTGATSGLILWALQSYAFGGDVPSAVTVFVPVAVASAAAWLSRHTHRPQA